MDMDKWPQSEPFDEQLAGRMCRRAARRYAEAGGAGSGPLERLSVNLTRLGSRLTQVHLYDNDLWRQGQPGERVWWVARLVALFFYYRLAHMGLNTILQYIHDYSLIRLRQLDALPAKMNPAEACTKARGLLEAGQLDQSSERGRLFANLATARWGLESIGSPYRDFTLMIELLHLMEMWVGVLACVRPYLMHRFVHAFDYNTVKMLDDSERERARYTATTISLLNKLAISSQSRADSCQSLGSRLMLRAQHRHWRYLQRLRRLSLAGRLEPTTRSAWCMRKLNRLRFYVSVVYGLPAILIYTALVLLVPRLDWITHVAPVYHDYASNQTLVEYILVTCMAMSCCSVHLGAASTMLKDRIELLRNLEALVDQCLLRGRRLLQGPRHGWCPSASESFNEQLALVVIHYKLAVEHGQDGLRTLSLLSLLMTEVLLVMPVGCMLHAPFFDPHIGPYLFGLYFLIFAVVDICLVPVCHLHSRACCLYRASTRLLAQLARLELLKRKSRGRASDCGPQLLDEHLVWLLRAELNHPRMFVERLSVKVIGYTFNYTRFMRIHFWGGLILALAGMAGSRISTEGVAAGSDSLTHRFLSFI